MLDFIRNAKKQHPKPLSEQNKFMENPDKPAVYINTTGKAEVWECSFGMVKRVSLLGNKAWPLRCRPVALLLMVLFFSLLFLLLTGYGSDPRTGRVMSKKTADYQKICCLSNADTSSGARQMILYVTPDKTASLALPSNSRQESPQEGAQIDQILLTADGRVSILLETVKQEDLPVTLRTLHRLTLENMAAELDAVIAAQPRFFITRGGNEAFDTRMKDERYDYGIITAASQNHFVTVILAAERMEEGSLQEQLDDLISAAGLSLFVN